MSKNAEDDAEFDGGFRRFKLDDTNMKDVYYAPVDYQQTLLDQLESKIKEDRTDLDLLLGCLLCSATVALQTVRQKSM